MWEAKLLTRSIRVADRIARECPRVLHEHRTSVGGGVDREGPITFTQGMNFCKISARDSPKSGNAHPRPISHGEKVGRSVCSLGSAIPSVVKRDI